jgi:anti-sigma regulatory factor (Ser/Thr protein kinase)
MLELLYKERKTDENVFRKDFIADENNLPEVQFFAKTVFEKYGLDDATIRKIELAVEEIFVNVSHYAYTDNEGRCSVIIKNEENAMTITFIDNGVKFNPLEKSDPDISVSSEEREIGGLGIFITKKIMDEVLYKYQDGYNMLTIKKTYK